MAKPSTFTLLTCLLTLAAVHLAPRDARAAEIGYDIREQKFSGHIPHGEAFQIVLNVKQGSSATLTYWPYFKARRSKTSFCDDTTTPPADATTFAARPGEVKEGNVKLAFDMPKLYPNQDYCFVVNVQNVRPLDDSEKARVATALKATLDDLASGESTGISPACAAKMTDERSRDPRCGVVELFARHLTLHIKVKRANDPKSGAIGLPEVLREALANDLLLLADLDALYKKNLARRDFQDHLANLGRKLPELTKLYRGFDLEKPLYEPPAGKRTAKQPIADKSAEAARPEMPKVTAPKDAADRLVRLAALDHTKDFGVAAAEFKLAFASVLGLADCQKKDTLPSREFMTPAGLDAKKLAVIDGIWTNSCDVVQVLGDIAKIDPESRAGLSGTSITNSDGFMRMLSTVQSVTVDAGPGVHVTSAGSRQNAFPFYASVDIGLAPIFFSRSTVNLAQYFAINLYFTAVDPDEPLYRPGRNRGTDFLRRFSVSAGITSTGRQIENARNVSGLVGNQLPLLGLGFRVLRMVRVSGGVALYNQKDPNPVVDRHRISVAPYIALSLDVALFTWAKGLLP